MTARITLPAIAGALLSTLPVASASADGFRFGLSFGSSRSCYVEPIVWDHYDDWGSRDYVYYDRRPKVVYRRTYSPRVAYTRVYTPRDYPRTRVIHRGRTSYRRAGTYYRRTVRRTRPHASRVYYRTSQPSRRYYGGSVYYRSARPGRHSAARVHYRSAPRHRGGISIRLRR